MASDGREIEIKLRVRDIAELRGKLCRLRAVAGTRTFERNILYDTPGEELRSSGRLLRIRIESAAPVSKAAAAGRGRRSARGLQVAARGVLTYKAPIVGMRSRTPRRYKQREEFEINSSQPSGSSPSCARSAFAPDSATKNFAPNTPCQN